MDSKLEIIWDGDVPGLAEHRVSLDAFGDSLNRLLMAFRRIASNMFRDAVEEGPATRGPHLKGTKFLDLEIDEIKKSSSGLGLVSVLRPPPGETMFLFEDLTQRAGAALLEAIEQESQGVARDAIVRAYLESLPEGVSSQEYNFTANGYSKTVRLGSVHLPKPSENLAYLTSVTGFLVAVGFEPGTATVSVKGDGRTLTCSATMEQVEEALKLRSRKIIATAVVKDRPRLLNLRLAGEELQPLSADEDERVLFGKWDNLLRKLAQ